MYEAPIEERIARVLERRNIDDEEKARLLIEREDSRRAKYYNYYTGKTWGAASSYDACINVSLLGIDATVDFVIALLKRRFC